MTHETALTGRRTRVKICGITRIDDARVAARLGADAVGVVFAPSPRRVEPADAVEIYAALGPLVNRVGVFVDQPIEFVRAAVRRCGLHVVQMSGREPAEYAAQVGAVVIKAVHVVGPEDVARYASYPADAFLLDAPPDQGRMGGTGRRFTWNDAGELPWVRTRVIVAGGLTPENVGAAIEWFRPMAVDVSSGVEASPGIKDPEKIQSFVEAVAAADARIAGRNESAG